MIVEGECILLDDCGEVVLRKRSNGYWGVSFAIENRTLKKNKKGKKGKKKGNKEGAEVEDDAGQDMTFTLDCSASTNVTSGKQGLVVEENGEERSVTNTVIVKPGEIQIVHHLVPKTQGPWSWNYKASWDFL